MSAQPTKPIKEFRTHNHIRAAVWANPSEKGDRPRLSVSVDKSYRDSEGSWKTSHTYFPRELPELRLVIDQAFAFIMTQGGEVG